MGSLWIDVIGPGAMGCRVPVEVESLRGSLPMGFVLKERGSQVFSVEILDTYSWGLWGSGQILFRCNASLTLWSQGNGLVTGQGAAPAEGGFFWWNLRESDFREALGEASGIRKIEPVISLEIDRREFEVSNGEGKVVYRFLLGTLRGKEGSGVGIFQGRPLRGYVQEANLCTKALETLCSEETPQNLLEGLLADAGITPHSAGKRPKPEIDPGLPSAEALCRVVRPALELAWGNESGIIRDTDTEFLHEYRVGLRRARSALALMSGVYANSEVTLIREQLGRMASATNRLRDFDVHLLERRNYEQAVPSVLSPAVRGLFDGLAAERAAEHARVASALLSESHQRSKTHISGLFLLPGGLPPGEEAEIPVGVAVALRLGRRYRKIRKLAAPLSFDAPESELHALRIQCKKLRYLLEFFFPLVPETSALLERPLRRLQNRLGALNDAAVQREFLLDLSRSRGNELRSDHAVAIGALVGILHTRGAAFRVGALRALEALTTPSLEKAVRRSLARPTNL